MARSKKKAKVTQPNLKRKEEEALPFVKKIFELLTEADGNVDFLYQRAREWISNFVDKHGDKAMDMILSGLFALKKTGEFPPYQSFYVILDVIVEVIKERGLVKLEHTKRIAQMLEWEEINKDLSVSRWLCLMLGKLNSDLAAKAEMRLEKADRERKPEDLKVDVEAIIAKFERGGCEATVP